MPHPSPLSPESRRKHIAEEARTKFHRQIARVRPGSHAFEIAPRVAVGPYNEGFIHAGNLAYLSLMTQFPFFIVEQARASISGRLPEDSENAGRGKSGLVRGN